jgi:DNA-binding TFAR19-related protein (PDSD5 family)
MASGLIYIAIIGMWVAYFAPRWIHDRNEFSGKSVERFKSALRVVANQSPQDSSATGAIHIDLDREAKIRQVLLRRRITFLLIAFSLVTTVVGGVMKTMPYIYALVPASGLLIYIANVRRHVIAEQLHKRRLTQLQRRNSGVSTTNLAEVVQPKPSTEHWIPLSERELKGVVILPKGSAAARNEWQPTEIPVPTYVNAPKAVTPKRVIDLTIPGQWSEEQERLEREALAAASPSRDEIFDQQLADEAVERLNQARAANE